MSAERRLHPLSPARLFAALALVLLGASLGLTASEGRTDLEALRERWERKSPAERALLRERFEELSRLDPEARQALFERARELRGALQTLEHAPPAWVQERLREAGPGDRDRVLRRCLEDHNRWRGSEMRERMPAELVARLEAATTDEERAAVYKELFRRGREEMFPRFVRGVGRRLDLDAAEIERLQRTPASEQEAVVHSLKRLLFERRGRPEEVSEEQWQAWQALPDIEFVRRAELSGAFWSRDRRERGGRPPWRRGGDRDGRGEDDRGVRDRGEWERDGKERGEWERSGSRRDGDGRWDHDERERDGRDPDGRPQGGRETGPGAPDGGSRRELPPRR